MPGGSKWSAQGPRGLEQGQETSPAWGSLLPLATLSGAPLREFSLDEIAGEIVSLGAVLEGVWSPHCFLEEETGLPSLGGGEGKALARTSGRCSQPNFARELAETLTFCSCFMRSVD